MQRHGPSFDASLDEALDGAVKAVAKSLQQNVVNVVNSEEALIRRGASAYLED